MFRCEHQKDISKCDIALVGVPHSTGNGTTERDQHLGPRAVRHVSAGLRRVHLDFNINPWKEKKIFDLGDVALPHANNNERCIEDITNFYTNIAKEKKYPFCILMPIQILSVNSIILWEQKKVPLTGELI